MNKRIVSCSILFGFIALCFILFALPAVKETNYYEGANGYKVLFGEVNVKQYNEWYPSKAGVFGILTLIVFFGAVIADVIAFILALKDNDAWISVALIGMIATFLFGFFYIFIAESLPISLRSGGKYITYESRGKPAGGAIFTGILAIIASISSACICFGNKKY